jgi:iron transport multicopper oxidase
MFDTVPPQLVLNITSTVSYDSSKPVAPGTVVDTYHEFPDQQLVPLEIEAQAEADVAIELGVYFDTATDGTNRAFFNNVTYRMPVVPTYLTTTSMGADALNPSIYGQTNTFILEHGQNVQL